MSEPLTELAALTRARTILGRRAKLLRDGDICVVARSEMSQTGERFVKQYGRGATWEEALEAADVSYQAMRDQHRRPA